MQTGVPALRAHPSGAVPCVKETALAANSGGQHEITTKWVLNAQETQKGIESLEDKSGETITYSKGYLIILSNLLIFPSTF